MKALLRWLVNRQMSIEGGFNGRTNKLVDSCYSFWQGSIFNMLMMFDKDKYTYNKEQLFNQEALQAYVLFCCQNRKDGGCIDKPSKYPDLYHTYYATAGYALSQQTASEETLKHLTVDDMNTFDKFNSIYGVSQRKVKAAKEYFKTLLK